MTKIDAFFNPVCKESDESSFINLAIHWHSLIRCCKERLRWHGKRVLKRISLGQNSHEMSMDIAIHHTQLLLATNCCIVQWSRNVFKNQAQNIFLNVPAWKAFGCVIYEDTDENRRRAETTNILRTVWFVETMFFGLPTGDDARMRLAQCNDPQWQIWWGNEQSPRSHRKWYTTCKKCVAVCQKLSSGRCEVWMSRSCGVISVLPSKCVEKNRKQANKHTPVLTADTCRLPKLTSTLWTEMSNFLSHAENHFNQHNCWLWSTAPTFPVYITFYFSIGHCS